MSDENAPETNTKRPFLAPASVLWKLPIKLWNKLGKARLIAVVLLVALMALRIWDPGPLETVRLKTFDFYQQTKPRPIPADSPVVIIDLDEKSLKEIGQWPWPRSTLRDMTIKLFQSGVKVVGFDIMFPEADRMSGSLVAKALPGLSSDLKKRLSAMTSNDELLGSIIKQASAHWKKGYGVVVGQSGLNEERVYKDRKPLVSKVHQRRMKGAPKPYLWVPAFPGLLRNVLPIEKYAAGHGLLNLTPEIDGIVRRVPAFFRLGKKLYPTLAVESMRVYSGRRGIITKGTQSGISDVIISKKLKVPTDKNGRMWPYFSRSDKSKYISAVDVLNGVADPNKIKGKIALVGTSAAGLLDIKTVPTERFIPGVEIHAQLIESVVHKLFLSRPNFSDALEMSLALFGGILIIILVPWIGAKWSLLAFLFIAAGSGYSSWYLFSEERMIIDAAFGILTVLLLYITLTYTSYAAEEAERRQTRDAFSKYLSPAMVEAVVEDPNLLTLGGAKRDLTLLFCDVRGFTSISELFDAEGLTVLINKLLTPLTDIILARKGTIDKYMGDCIMAFWNAPLDDKMHAEDGCRSALAMVAAMAPLNERLKQEAEEEGRKHLDLKVGLGLNSGEAVVGNMGTAQRMDYSVLGDTVNTAARLEGQSKTYGVDIVLGPSTCAQVPDFATVELDNIQVKGKTVGLLIYALLGDEEVAKDPAFIAVKEAVEEMIREYRNQAWDKARELANKVRAAAETAAETEVGAVMAVKAAAGDRFKLDVLCELYEGRIAAYEENPPPEDWNGVFIATTK